MDTQANMCKFYALKRQDFLFNSKRNFIHISREFSFGNLEKESHSAALTVMQKIELVHELVGVVRSLRQSAQVSNQTDVVRLRVEFFLESGILNDRQTMTQSECFA